MARTAGITRVELLQAERVLVQPTDAAAGLFFGLVSPSAYFVGMSSLAVHSLWRILADDPQFRCERIFYDDPSRKPSSLESQRPLRQFDVLGFSLAFELEYLRAVEMLHAAGLSPLSADRDSHDPLVIAGGVAVSANPAPVSDIFDGILVGEAEEALPQALEVIAAATSRTRAMEGLATVPGFYVPPVHGRPTDDGGGVATIAKQTVRDLDGHVTASAILTPHTEFGGRFLVEVGRGCGRGCRFCLAGHIYRPHRQRSIEAILDMSDEGLRYTDRIGLVGAALSDYDDIEALVISLRERGARISTSSLRAESVTPGLLAALADSGQRQITLAPEAATQRLRDLLRKPTTEEHFWEAVRMARDAGINRCKLYFMFALPTETDEDLRAVGALVRRIERRFPGVRLSVSAAPFVPKAHTPFQWEPMLDVADLRRRARCLREAVRTQSNASLRTESPRWAHVQAVLSRGGPELGPVIVESVRRGGSPAAFRRALAVHNVRADESFAHPDVEAPLPWDLIAGVPSKETLWRQREIVGR